MNTARGGAEVLINVSDSASECNFTSTTNIDVSNNPSKMVNSESILDNPTVVRDSCKLIVWNIYGINDEFIDDDHCGGYLKTGDVVLLSESWAPPGDGDDLFPLDEFKAFNFSRGEKHKDAPHYSGGLLIYIRRSLLDKGVFVKNHHKDIVAWIRLDKNYFGFDKDIFIANCYFVPEGSPYRHPDPFGIVKYDMTQLQNEKHTLVCGDVNSHVPDFVKDFYEPIGDENDLELNFEPLPIHVLGPEQLMRQSSDKRPLNDLGRDLIDFCISTNNVILNGRKINGTYSSGPTYIKGRVSGVNDYCIASPGLFKLIKSFEIGNKFPESDHLPLELVLHCNYIEKSKEVTDISQNWDPCFKYQWEKAELDNLKYALKDEVSYSYRDKFLNSVSELENTEQVAKNFDEYVNQACRRVFKFKCQKRFKKIKNKKKWFNPELKVLRGKAVKAGERVHSLDDRIKLDEATRKYKNTRQRFKRTFKRSGVNKLMKLFKNGKNNLWEGLKEFEDSGKGDTGPSADQIYEHFKNLSSKSDDNNFDLEYEKTAKAFIENFDNLGNFSENDLESEIINKNFSVEEIKCAVDYLKNNKSAGSDYIPAEFIKHCKNELVDDITTIFNYIIEKREFPTEWAEGVRSAVFKNGDRRNPNNYRGITVAKIFEKIFEIALFNRLNFANEAFCKVDESNGGFLKGRRTTDNIFILYGLIQKQLLLGKKLYVCFIDFSKAFDLINRHILFYKIMKSGWSGRLIDTLRDLYSKTHFRIKHNGKLSDKLPDFLGVKQGGNASGLLFRKYMADLSEYLKTEHGIMIDDQIIAHLLWADDLVLISDTISGLKKQLEGLKKFCHLNQMTVNELKTKVMVFGSDEKVEVEFNNKVIEQVDKYKYVGCIINSIKRHDADPFALHYTYLCDKARKAEFAIYKKVKNLGHIPPGIKLFMFSSMVRPILTYSSDIWGIFKGGCKKVNGFHLRFVKKVLKVRINTSSLMSYGESGQLPISLDCESNVCKFLNRVKHMGNNTLVNKVYLELCSLQECGFNTWVGKAEDMVNKYDLSFDSNLNKFKNSVKKLIENSFISNWEENINDSITNPGLRTYKLFKQEFGFEKYLHSINSFKHWNSLIKLRTSTHDLNIEVGRHIDIRNRSLRNCNFCNDKIEDEIHFLLECPVYHEERASLLHAYQINPLSLRYLDMPTLFSTVMSSRTRRHLDALGRFAYEAFTKRRGLLYDQS